MADPHPAPEMLPCQCGLTATKVYHGVDNWGRQLSQIGCLGCGRRSRFCDTEAEAIAAWDRRAALASEPPQPVVVPGDVERVARAIASQSCPYEGPKADRSLDEWVDEHWSDFTCEAKAAIAALTVDAALIAELRERAKALTEGLAGLMVSSGAEGRYDAREYMAAKDRARALLAQSGSDTEGKGS